MAAWLPALSLAYATGCDFRALLTRRPNYQTLYIRTDAPTQAAPLSFTSNPPRSIPRVCPDHVSVGGTVEFNPGSKIDGIGKETNAPIRECSLNPIPMRPRSSRLLRVGAPVGNVGRAPRISFVAKVGSGRLRSAIHIHCSNGTFVGPPTKVHRCDKGNAVNCVLSPPTNAGATSSLRTSDMPQGIGFRDEDRIGSPVCNVSDRTPFIDRKDSGQIPSHVNRIPEGGERWLASENRGFPPMVPLRSSIARRSKNSTMRLGRILISRVGGALKCGNSLVDERLSPCWAPEIDRVVKGLLLHEGENRTDPSVMIRMGKRNRLPRP